MTRIERAVGDGRPADVEWHGDDGWIMFCGEGAVYIPASRMVLPPEVVAAVGFRKAEPLRFCVDHKLELVRRGYGSAEAIGALPVASPDLCCICRHYRRLMRRPEGAA